MQERYPRDISVDAREVSAENKESLLELVQQSAKESGTKVENLVSYEELSVTTRKNGETFSMSASDSQAKGTISQMSFMTLEEYEKMSGNKEQLEENEVLVYVFRGEGGDTAYDIQGTAFHIKKYMTNYPKEQLGTAAVVIADSYYVIVKDETVLNQIYETQKEVYGEHASQKHYEVLFDIEGGEEKEERYTQVLNGKIQEYRESVLRDGSAAWINDSESRVEGQGMLYILYGGFLFLGIFLGFVFLMATVLIIYYKQISEGYEDKERYEIMRKVGMSHKEVKASIRSQIIKVFFLPLLTACIHLSAAFPLISRLLMLFGMTNTGLFVVCTLATVLVFTVSYGVVYLMTARTYYKIVE